MITMEKELISGKVKEYAAHLMNIPEEEVKEESRLTNDLGYDSLDVLELIAQLETEFLMDIPSVDVEQLRTVGDVIVYIDSRINPLGV